MDSKHQASSGWADGTPTSVRPPRTRGAAPRRPGCASAEQRRILSARSSRSLVRFLLQPVTGGLYVEREDIPLRGPRTSQSIGFADAVAFERWCDADSVRFDNPLLHTQLKREGDLLWRLVSADHSR